MPTDSRSTPALSGADALGQATRDPGAPVVQNAAAAPGALNDGQSLDDVLASIERREILAALDRANGQRTRAAEMLRISRSRLYRRMEALGIKPPDEAPPPPA